MFNIPFYRYGDHIELIRFKEYYGMPRGALVQYLRALFGQRELQYIFFGKNVIIITPKHGTTIYFSHYNLFLRTLREKSACKARVNTDAMRVYRIMLMPPGHSIILLKSN